ncbi:hypothetical protein SAMN06296036_102153 [Pseudobacteriovorax antillogorgiicola]|uniref:Uncharacterized protein n=1 Tax=Pseudobacteriovorax antillogorgiicola TaxID=1513793 RepID=A0A1Y6B7P6_9BACT|nr:hypothetical protein EDD56_102290 [Pseudobacteriovorax antillogorgiicola]SME94887.1 hypothetical protein SAMN06296036_102153 [Pseudobacteriovorax antillogorgiicola]
MGIFFLNSHRQLDLMTKTKGDPSTELYSDKVFILVKIVIIGKIRCHDQGQ